MHGVACTMHGNQTTQCLTRCDKTSSLYLIDVITFIQSCVHANHVNMIAILKQLSCRIKSREWCNSGANASECLEKFVEMFYQYYMHSDVLSRSNYTTTQ